MTKQAKTVKTIKAIFEQAKHQADALLDIYRLYIPDFDEIALIHGHPKAGRELWLFIAELFVQFDKVHHPKVMPGGLWLNNGFSHGEKLKGWDVTLTSCIFEY